MREIGIMVDQIKIGMKVVMERWKLDVEKNWLDDMVTMLVVVVTKFGELWEFD